MYPVAFTTDISLRSISVVYATGYNADIRGIGTNTVYLTTVIDHTPHALLLLSDVLGHVGL